MKATLNNQDLVRKTREGETCLDAKKSGSSLSPGIAFNTILAPVDFSAASRQGLAFAAAVARRFNSHIDVIYVVEPIALPQWGYAHIPVKEAKLHRAAKEWLPQFVGESNIDASCVRSMKIRGGIAASEICAEAAETKADLIVFASHGLGGLKHAILGSTAERVLRLAPCPVLTVRDHTFPAQMPQGPTFAPRRILVTTDFSPASQKAFPCAAALARKLGSALILVHVVPSHLPAQFSHLGVVLEAQTILSAARKKLPQLCEAGFQPQLHVESLVLHGGEAFEICKAATDRGVDLIVMATHGYRGLKRLALGSVTNAVVRHAPCPVLVVRERECEFSTTA